MNQEILSENQKKRLTPGIKWLICFAMYSFWQMGFIYFMGPSLNIDGRTPLPISMDNITILIALAYVISIIWMIAMPKLVIWTERVAAGAALMMALGLFLPLPEDTLRLLIYAQTFICCFMIGFETFIMVNYFSEEGGIHHLTLAYGVALFLIAIVQNDSMPITFPVFRLATVLALLALIAFLIYMPAGKEACPKYVKKKDGIVLPKKLMIGTFILVFVGALMGVSGPAIAGEIPNGVFSTYLVDGIASFMLYFLYIKWKLHPFRTIPACMGLGCIGFLLVYVSEYIPGLAHIGCGLIGFGMVPCQMLPLYNLVLMKSYPSKHLAPITIGLSLVAVLVQSSMVEVFRNDSSMLCLTYAVIMVTLAVIYLQIEPYLLYTLRRKIPKVVSAEDNFVEETAIEETMTGEIKEENMQSAKKQEMKEKIQIEKQETLSLLKSLTKRELEVVDLISVGYSNSDIAKALFISVYTVNDHTKNIYRKMGVHSRLELANLVNKLK